ncbi:MAG: BatA and WFA domain-containing protein [Phycisphaerae bacterium]
MSFLNLWAFWIAAGVVPALLILYFLKLRRREESVASTLLWKRAVQDLQVNAPFQRLRKNLLLLLQLLILAAGVVALARPIVSGTESYEGRVVMLIDRSASMNAIEEDGKTRLEIAKEQAIKRAKTFNSKGSSWLKFVGVEPKTQVMVVSFADQASVLQPFTTNMIDVVAAIEEIKPSDSRTDLSEGVQLAQAYLSPPSMITQGMEDTPVSAQEPGTLLLFSDGRIPNAATIMVKGEADSVEWIRIGESRDNLGITAFRTRRDYEDPEILHAFVEVRNYSTETITTDVSIYLDDKLIDAKPITIPGMPAPLDPASSQPAETEAPPQQSMTTLTFDRPVLTAGTLEARLARKDALDADNRAFAIVPAPRKLRVLLVTEKNWLLETVLGGLPLEKVDVISPGNYEAAPEGQLWSNNKSLFDVVIFDKHSTAKLPVGNYFFLGAVPQGVDISVGEAMDDYRLVWWDETHSVLRYVNLDYVVVSEGLDLIVPDTATKLIEANGTPSLVHLVNGGSNFLVLGFAAENSNLPKKVGFPAMIYNAVRWLGSGGAADRDDVLRPGDSLRITMPAGVSKATMRTPDGRNDNVPIDDSGTGRFGGTGKVGIYELRAGEEIINRFAVNLEDADESDISPPPQVTLGAGKTVRHGEMIRASTPEIWRWFIGAALIIIMLEWWIYNRRSMI